MFTAAALALKDEAQAFLSKVVPLAFAGTGSGEKRRLRPDRSALPQG